MSPQNGIKIATGGLVLYLTLSFVCLMTGDHRHAWVFLVGSGIWIATIFIWTGVKKDQE